uniref:Uncharacterized protein n=1 Tax=Urocitellus parryii TaxID=9999 RepID=A0A8D2GNK0_UROPR
MSASDTPKSRLDTSSLPPVSTPAPPPKPLSNRSCCHLSGSCFAPRAMPALPRPRPPPRPPRWLRFSLMMSSRDMSILSAMAGAESGLTLKAPDAVRSFLYLPARTPAPPTEGRGGA